MGNGFMSSSCCSTFASNKAKMARSAYRAKVSYRSEPKKKPSACDEIPIKSSRGPSRYVSSNGDLRDAISSIIGGCASSHQYRCRSGIYQLKLKLAQSWKDRGISYDVSAIIGMGHDELRGELGYGSSLSGRLFY